MMYLNSLFIVSAMSALAVLGPQEPSSKQKNPPAKTPASLPADLFLAKQPDAAKSVEEVKASTKAGEKVVIRGRIGGSKAPFVDGRAVFTLMGNGIKACSDKGEEKCCNTPWDYCCETPEEVAKHSATIQVIDPAGNPIRADLKGVNGLKELSEVIIQGTVKEAKDKVLIINASGLFVVRP